MLKINVGVTWYYTFGIVLLLHSNYNQPQVCDAIDQTGILGWFHSRHYVKIKEP